MSSSFSSKRLSLESLKDFIRCGFKPLATQMRPALEGLPPAAFAIDSRLPIVQWVPPAGLALRVSLIMCDLVEAGTGAMRPGRVLSLRMPANPVSAYLCRQRPTFPGSCLKR